MKFKTYLKDNNFEYGLPNSKQNMIDELVNISDTLYSEQKFITDPVQIFQMACEIKFKKDMDALKTKMDDARLQVIDILKEKYSKQVTINNDKETSNKEKETENERPKRKSKESSVS